MQKVVCSVSRRNGNGKCSGFGYLSENNLFFPAMSSTGKPYIRVIEDISSCRKRGNNEFAGYVTQMYENVDVHTKDKVRDHDRYERIDCLEIEYYVWFKYVD